MDKPFSCPATRSCTWRTHSTLKICHSKPKNWTKCTDQKKKQMQCTKLGGKGRSATAWDNATIAACCCSVKGACFIRSKTQYQNYKLEIRKLNSKPQKKSDLQCNFNTEQKKVHTIPHIHLNKSNEIENSIIEQTKFVV